MILPFFHTWATLSIFRRITIKGCACIEILRVKNVSQYIHVIIFLKVFIFLCVFLVSDASRCFYFLYFNQNLGGYSAKGRSVLVSLLNG